MLCTTCKSGGGPPLRVVRDVGAGGASAPSVRSSLPRIFPLLHHDRPQRPINPRLITPPRLFEPGQNVSVQTKRNCLLDGPVQAPDPRHQIVRALPRLGRCLQRGNLPPPALPNSCPSFHLQIHVYNRPYKLASTKCSTWNTSPIQAMATLAPRTKLGSSQERMPSCTLLL
jgi:hypothetical protein